jgi:hypothetical protein
MKKLILFLVCQCCFVLSLCGQSNEASVPNSEVYYDVNLQKVKSTEQQMNAQKLGGLSDSPLHLKKGDIIFFKTNAGNYGKLQLMSFSSPNGSKNAELNVRYVVYRSSGGQLKFSEFSNWVKPIQPSTLVRPGTKVKKNNQVNVVRGQFEIDKYMGKVYNDKKPYSENNRTAQKDSIYGTIYTGFSWYINNDVLFIEPYNVSLYLFKANFSDTKTSDANPFSTPVITWQHQILNKSTTNLSTFDLKACIETSETPKEYTLIQNGQRLSISRGLIPRKATDCVNNFSQTVTLKEGENTFQLEAQVGKNTLKSDIFTLFYSKNTDGATPSVSEAKSEKRIALVVGNGDYTEGSKLKNPVNDANLMAQTLNNLGFRVMQVLNTNKVQLEKAIRDFSVALPDYNVALFYYAGHGIQLEGENYIIPIDAKLRDKKDVRFEAVKVKFAIEEFERHPDNVNIVILDACRNNPFRSWARGGSEGFKQMDVGGTLIAFATAPDATASDGTGTNGLYTEELVKQMQVNQPIEAVFRETRKVVLNRSNRTQNPQEWSQLTQSFYFKK